MGALRETIREIDYGRARVRAKIFELYRGAEYREERGESAAWAKEIWFKDIRLAEDGAFIADYTRLNVAGGDWIADFRVGETVEFDADVKRVEARDGDGRERVLADVLNPANAELYRRPRVTTPKPAVLLAPKKRDIPLEKSRRCYGRVLVRATVSGIDCAGGEGEALLLRPSLADGDMIAPAARYVPGGEWLNGAVAGDDIEFEADVACVVWRDPDDFALTLAEIERPSEARVVKAKRGRADKRGKAAKRGKGGGDA